MSVLYFDKDHNNSVLDHVTRLIQGNGTTHANTMFYVKELNAPFGVRDSPMGCIR